MRKRLSPVTLEAMIVLGVLTIAFAGAIAGITVWLVDQQGEPAAAETTTVETAATETAETETAATETAETETAATETAATETAATETAATTEAGGGDATAGAEVFASAGCGSCHTLSAAGATGAVGPNLDDAKPDFTVVVEFVTNGSGAMPAFGNQGILSEQQIEDVAAFVVQATSG